MDCLVSVVVPTYKRQLNYISRAIRSLLNQTYGNIEILLIDDNPLDYELSSDIKAYADGLGTDKIVYIKNEKNLGGSLSRNVGIFAAKGEYITFLDDDDEYMPQKIEKQLEFMLKTDADLSFCNMIIYGLNGEVCDYRDHKGIPSFDNDDLLRYHLTKNLSGTPTFMFKTEKLREIGGFRDAKMGQDFFLMLNAIESGLKIRYLDACDIKVYKHNDGGISQGMNKIVGEKMLYDFKKQYFDRLSYSEIKYINFRHKIVMAVAYKRNKRYLRLITNGVSAFFVSPKFFFSELFSFAKNMIKYK